MLTNIIDKRKYIFRWKAITAIAEPTCHDNSCMDSDRAEMEDSWAYDEMSSTSLPDAIAWANSLPGQTTLYIYDLGKGISSTRIVYEEA